MTNTKILSCYTNYEDALTDMKKYESTVTDSTYITYNNKIINAEYGIFNFDLNESTVKIYNYNSNGVLVQSTYTSPNHGMEALLLDYVYAKDSTGYDWYYKVILSGIHLNAS